MTKKRAIDLLDEAVAGDTLSFAELVEEAARLHDACPCCHGSGGGFHPEQPCPECGLTVFESVGLEGVKR